MSRARKFDSDQGLEISLTPVPAEVVLGQPVRLHFSVNNGLLETVAFDLGKNQEDNFKIEITFAGSHIKAENNPQGGFGPESTVKVDPGAEFHHELFLDRWYAARVPGEYQVRGSLGTGFRTVMGRMLSAQAPGFTLRVLSRDATVLESLCTELEGKTQDSSDAAHLAARELSYVRDPIAVPFLARLINAPNRSWWQYAIPGLARIGNADAVAALETVVQNKEVTDGGGRALAVFVLDELRSGGANFELRMD